MADNMKPYDVKSFMPNPIAAKVAIVMGSKSDWDTMQKAGDMLALLEIDYEVKVLSAHRTPLLMYDYAKAAEKRGLKVIIAGAGGAAHLPGMVASLTILPVIGVPVESKELHGLDSLLSIAQMPQGVPVAAMAIGGGGNAALMAARILALQSEKVRLNLSFYMSKLAEDS